MDPLPALETAVTTASDPVAKVRALTALSTELARTGHARRAFTHAQEARAIAAQMDNPQLDAETRHAIGRCHFYLADFVPALELLFEAAKRYQSCGDQAGTATSFAGIGICQHRLGAFDDSISWLLRALDSARLLEMKTLEINIHNSLGSVLLDAKRIDEAARYLGTGIELAHAAGNRNLLTKLLLNQALLAKERGQQQESADAPGAMAQFAQGLAQASQALALARELHNAYDEAYCLCDTGTMLRLLRRNDEADSTLRQALVLAEALDDAHLQAEALRERGTLLSSLGQLTEATALLRKAVALAKRAGNQGGLAKACATLSAVLEQSGDLTGALALYKEFHEVREAELAGSRRHAANAAELWLDFQDASRSAAKYRQQAEALAADHAALRKEAKELTEASQHDPLTGLLNRRGLDARIGVLVAASEVNDVPLSIALIDVDLFKRINDTFSHAVGDAVLRRVAGFIRSHCRQNDLPVRYGGDEFLLVLADVDLKRAKPILERLKRACDAFEWDKEATGLRVTLSIGVALRARGGTIAGTIAMADHALYQAKAGGRDRIASRQ
jgi:two-component system cell cycle response regulator